MQPVTRGNRTMATNYSDIIMYLDAIAGNANGSIGGAPHKTWWRQGHIPSGDPLSYEDFVSGTVYGVNVPIIDQTDPTKSKFYVLLTTSGGADGYNQMPWRGPYITDQGYEVQLSNGDVITGSQIMENIEGWLSGGYPQ